MSKLTDETFLQEYLAIMYGKNFPGLLVLWNKQTKATRTFTSASIPALIAAVKADAGRNDLYFGLATQSEELGAGKRGGNSTAVQVPALFADIDISTDKTNGKKYVSDEKTALRILAESPYSPTLLQRSGGGLHAIYVLDVPIICRTEADRKRAAKLAKDFHRKLAKHFLQHGYEIDDCSDLARVYRVPMSFNHKYGEPRRVEVLIWNPEARIDVAALPVTTTPAASASRSDKPQERDADHELICQHCPWYRHMTGDGAATASEPEWFGAGAVTACCAHGRELFHTYSADHPQYNQREADKKFDHLERDVQPPTCVVIAENYGGETFCASCEWRGRIKSPVLLGRARVTILTEGWPDVTKSGKPIKSLPNALEAARRTDVTFEYDSFHNRMRIGGHVLQGYQGDLSDNASAQLHYVILEDFGFDPGKGHLLDAIHILCVTNAHHPILTYLDGLVWDGTARLENWLVIYLGAEDTALNRAIGMLLLVAAVRRVQQPGAKFDTIVILEGSQGTGKSTAIEILAGKENFSDQSLFSMSEKEIMEALEGVWFYEIPELDGYSRAENSKVKAIISRTEDRGRAAYARFKTTWKRQNVFIATTNEAFYLKDPTGNRRFLPVKTGIIDLQGLRRDRDQLFAEAAMLEAQGFSIVLPEELWQTAKAAQDERMQEDPWLDILSKVHGRVIDGEERIHTDDIFSDEYLDISKAQRKSYHLKQVAITMRALGWEGPMKLRIHGVLARGYARPSDQPDDVEF